MKRALIILSLFILVLSIPVMADNQGTIGAIDDTIGVAAKVGKYAAVVPQKLEWEYGAGTSSGMRLSLEWILPFSAAIRMRRAG